MEPRLWKQLKPVRRLLVVIALTSLSVGVLIVVQAQLLADIVSRAYLDHAGLHALLPVSEDLLGVLMGRALMTGLGETWSLNLATQTQITLRERLFSQVLRSGPLALSSLKTGTLVTTAVQGIDDLEIFLARYLPQMVVTALIPAVIVIRVISRDWISGGILLVTVPLIPFFMILIGRQSEGKNQRQWDALTRLNGHFLNILQGLDTLKLFGQSRSQSKGIVQASDQFRVATMATLRIAFLSGLVLELLASLSMAFIAVAIGLRLIAGAIPFDTAFMILVLIPEFYIPWRALGAKFHDGLKGLTAAKEIFDILDTPLWASHSGVRTLPDPGPWTLHFEHVGFTYPHRTLAALDDVTFTIMPGERLALVGPSGSGKSTLISLLLGLGPYRGAIRIGSQELMQLSLAWWRRQITWVTQHPYLFDATIRDNLLLVRPDASPEDLERALAKAYALEYVRSLPKGLDTAIGPEGSRLSGGQRQRLALARAFLQDTPLIIFDEPTQSLDLATEKAFVAALDALSEGRTTITVAHRLVTIAKADRVIFLQSGRIVQTGSPHDLGSRPGMFQSFVQAYSQGGEGVEPALLAPNL